tara:strand:- start:390 stop:614 length:225 start_codon:yes stop_codon:yes gene_type:complete
MHIYDEIKATGAEIDCHESDLYARATPEVMAIIDRRKKAGEIVNASRFTSEIDGTGWVDIAFAYRPFWDRKPRG